RQFFDHDRLGHVVGARAAIFDGDPQSGQLHGPAVGEVLPRVGGGAVDLSGARGDLVFGELAHGRTELVLLGAECYGLGHQWQSGTVAIPDPADATDVPTTADETIPAEVKHPIAFRGPYADGPPPAALEVDAPSLTAFGLREIRHMVEIALVLLLVLVRTLARVIIKR